MTFEDLGLNEALLASVQLAGYTTPTPIQEQAISHVLEGRDVLGIAQTGTGKTAAFALPILQRLGKNPAAKARGRKARVLVLSPTRELATQIADSFGTYGKKTGLRQAVIYGGVSQHPQAKAVREGVDIIVATPGRLLDLMQQRLVTLDGIEILVIDEADRMFDMGFIRDLRKIVAAVPTRRQSLMFSATMPDDIRELADRMLSNPVTVRVAAKSADADTVEQGVYFVEKNNKPALLTHFIQSSQATRALVFTRTKRGADKVAKHLSRSGIRAEAIHGNKSQAARQRALVNFKSNKPPVLVATDVAARGLDIDEVSHVVNYDLPEVPETYVHRIGRTGRAGASGIAVSFCARDEREHLRLIEKLLRKKTPIIADQPAYKPGSESPEREGRSHRRDTPQRKPHSAAAATGPGRSRRRKFGATTEGVAVVARPAAKAAAQPAVKTVAKSKSPARAGYSTMW